MILDRSVLLPFSLATRVVSVFNDFNNGKGRNSCLRKNLHPRNTFTSYSSAFSDLEATTVSQKQLGEAIHYSMLISAGGSSYDTTYCNGINTVLSYEKRQCSMVVKLLGTSR